MKPSIRTLFLAATVALLPMAVFASQAAEPVVLRIDVDRTVLRADTTEKAIIKVALEGRCRPRPESRPPVNLALVIDRSGSMSGDKIEKAREAALEALSRLDRDDIISLIVFDDDVQTLVPARRVGDGRAVAGAIRAIRPGGSTNLFGGVSQAAAEVRKHSESRRHTHRVVLLSDGLANIGPSSPDDLARLGASLGKEGIAVSTIGLGLGFNEDLMTRLAHRSDGNTYFVESSRDLSDIFNRELGDILSVVARTALVEIEFPEHVRPLNFVGRDGEIRGQKAHFTLNQVYGGQEKFALVEVEVKAAREGTTCEIARAHLRYEDPVLERSLSATVGREVRFSLREEEVVASADFKVQTDYAENVIAITKDKAVELVDAKRPGAAGAELRRKAAELQEYGSTYRNSELVALAERNANEAKMLEERGLDNAARKTYRAESTQTRNQQSSSAVSGSR